MKNQFLKICYSTILFTGFQSIAIADALVNTMLADSNSVMTQQKTHMMNGQMMNGQIPNKMRNCQNRNGMMHTGNMNKGMMNSGNMGNGMMNRGMKGGCMNMSMQRHRFVMQNGIDSVYQNTVNPITNISVNVLSSGKKLYATNCASCHGQNGLGDGPLGVNLPIKPANIAAFSKMPMASDAYLNWTISEGGTPINSPMPAFKTQLNSQEIWSIIHYVRTL